MCSSARVHWLTLIVRLGLMLLLSSSHGMLLVERQICSPTPQAGLPQPNGRRSCNYTTVLQCLKFYYHRGQLRPCLILQYMLTDLSNELGSMSAVRQSCRDGLHRDHSRLHRSATTSHGIFACYEATGYCSIIMNCTTEVQYSYSILFYRQRNSRMSGSQ